MMEVQHPSGFEATVIQNFLQIAVEELGTKEKKRNYTLGILNHELKQCVMVPAWSLSIALKIFLHRQ